MEKEARRRSRCFSFIFKGSILAHLLGDVLFQANMQISQACHTNLIGPLLIINAVRKKTGRHNLLS